jgi:hypothetical protein
VEIFAGHIPEFKTPTCEYPLLFFSEAQKNPALFLRSGTLIALHHLFPFAGLKNERRNRIMNSGRDDIIVSKKI